MIFETCAQTLNLDFEATLWCFLRFFTCRRFFERVGALERKSMHKSAKSIAGDNEISQKSCQYVAKSLTNRKNLRTWTKICAGSAPRAPKIRPRAVQGRPKSGQERAKSAQDGAKRAQRIRLGKSDAVGCVRTRGSVE